MATTGAAGALDVQDKAADARGPVARRPPIPLLLRAARTAMCELYAYRLEAPGRTEDGRAHDWGAVLVVIVNRACGEHGPSPWCRFTSHFA